MTYHPTTTVLSPLLWLRKSLLEVGPGLRPWYSAVVRAFSDRNRIPISIVVCGLRRRETVSIAAAHGSLAKCLIINRSPWEEEEEADRPRQTKRVKSARSGSSPAQVKVRNVVSSKIPPVPSLGNLPTYTLLHIPRVPLPSFD